MEKYHRILVKYPSEIKIGDLIFFNDYGSSQICEVVNIKKGQRHSREDGYPYTFTGQKEGTLYEMTRYRDVVKYIKIK